MIKTEENDEERRALARPKDMGMRLVDGLPELEGGGRDRGIASLADGGEPTSCNGG